MKEAVFYNTAAGNLVICRLCQHNCLIRDGKLGICNVRKNIDGKLYTLNYDKVVARFAEPIEKKPITHYLQGTDTYSIAAPGCNFKCSFCQNSDISQVRANKPLAGERIAPSQIVQEAKDNGCKSISYTYTEPTVWYELMMDVARTAKEEGLKNILVTNGYMEISPLAFIMDVIDAVNVDLKGWDANSHRNVCRSSLMRVESVIRAISLKANRHLEISTTIIPGFNDHPKAVRSMALTIKKIQEISKRVIPWHLQRFHPAFRMSDREATPIKTMEQAYNMAKECGLEVVDAQGCNI